MNNFNIADFVFSLQMMIKSTRDGLDIIANEEDHARLTESLKELLQQGIKLKMSGDSPNMRKEVVFAVTDVLSIVTSISQ